MTTTGFLSCRVRSFAVERDSCKHKSFTDDHCQLRSHANVPGFRLLQRNRPIRLQLAHPRREFCLRELRGTKPVRRQTSLILANFSQLETLSATSQLIFSLYLSLEQDGGLLCLYVFSLASSPQLFTTTSLSSLQPVAVWSPRQRTPSPPLSLSLIVLKVCSLVTS